MCREAKLHLPVSSSVVDRSWWTYSPAPLALCGHTTPTHAPLSPPGRPMGLGSNLSQGLTTHHHPLLLQRHVRLPSPCTSLRQSSFSPSERLFTQDSCASATVLPPASSEADTSSLLLCKRKWRLWGHPMSSQDLMGPKSLAHLVQ